MTSPVIVGQVGVEVTATARGFARRLRDAVTREFKGAGLDKAIQEAIGGKTLTIPVRYEVDKRSIPRNLPDVPGTPGSPTRNRPTSSDALMKAFRDDVQRQLRVLAREAVRIPVTADTDHLRADLAQRIGEVQRHLAVQVPTEPGERGDYERSLRRMLTEVSARVRATVPPATVPVKLDPLTKAFQADVRKQVAALSREANLRIPVSADTAGVRARIAAQVAAIERTLKAEIPVEPGSRLAYETRLRAMVAQVSRSVRAEVEVHVDRNRFQQAVAAIASRLPTTLGSAFQRVGDTANATAQGVVTSMGQVAASLFSIVNPATLAAVAIGGTVAATLLLGPTAAAAAGGIGVLVGALAAAPAGFFGLGAVITTFALGLRGIADRFKETASGAGSAGQSAAAAARQMAAAQRGLAQAQRAQTAAERGYRSALAESLRAQRAVNEARQQARRRIEDLALSLLIAQNTERSAAIAVAEAQRALDEANRTGDPLEIARAQNDLERAELSAQEAARAARDAAEAKEDADKRGVEGSDEVTAALERQQQANDSLLSAADSVKSAQEGLAAASDAVAAANERTGTSAAGAAKKLLTLSPAATRFVDAVKSLKPAFSSLRLDVQERLFKGLDRTVLQVGTAWVGQLKTTLGSYADTFNEFFRDLGDTVSKPKFIEDIAAGAESVRQVIERIGRAVSGPFTEAMGKLSRAAKPFMDAFGDEVAKLVEDFSAWIGQADKSGKLQDFFEKTAGYLRDFFKVGRSVGRIFKSLVVILFGADAGKGSGVVETFERLADFLEDPENRKQIAEWVAKMKEFGRILLEDVLPPALRFLFWLEGLEEKLSGFKDAVGGLWSDITDGVGGFVDSVGTWLSELPGRIGGWLSGIPDSVGGFFSDATGRATRTVDGWLATASRQFGSVRGRVTGALSGLRDTLGGLLQGAVDRGAGVLGTLAGRAGTAASNAATRVRGALSGLGGDMYRIGQDVVRGLWNGIGDMGEWLRQRIRGFAGNVIGFFQQGFEVGSPSKRMADEVGRWLPAGLAVGMDDAVGVVKAARDRMIAAAIPEVDDAYQVKVAPVVDPYAGAAAAVPAPASTATTAQIEFVGDAPGSFMRWVKENVRVDFGGDANRAFGRAPTPVLADRR